MEELFYNPGEFSEIIVDNTLETLCPHLSTFLTHPNSAALDS